MAEPFAIQTGDPGFDPGQRITVNGYYFKPDDGHSLVLRHGGRRECLNCGQMEGRNFPAVCPRPWWENMR